MLFDNSGESYLDFGSSLSDVQKHFYDLYGKRNLFANGSFDRAALHVSRRIGRLADTVRKGEDMAPRLASAISYFMNAINYFYPHVDITRGMMKKFHSSGCVYCRSMPCCCSPEKRPDPSMLLIDEQQLTWSINDWTKHLERVYGANNKKQGFWYVHTRLSSEFGELSVLVAGGPRSPNSANSMLVECELEAADVLSWLLVIGYIHNIDVAAAIIKYCPVCPACHCKPCVCPLVFVSDDRKTFSTVGRRSVAP